MKQITAVIQPVRLGPVREALTTAGVTGMTIADVRGFGLQGGSTDTYRGVEYRVDYVPKVQITIVASDEVAGRAVEAIVEATRTGNVGDGKIWVSEVVEIQRIRTGELNEAALV